MNDKDVCLMFVIAFVVFALLVAVLAPIFGTDTSDARSLDAKDDRGWWPAGPTNTVRAHF
jgi:hypothetical protein